MVNMKREFGGMSAYVEEVDFDKHFEEIYNIGYRVVYLSKETFKHEEEDFNFDYKYAIIVIDVACATGEEDAPTVVELYLVPSFNNLSDNSKRELMNSVGWSEEEEVSEEWKWVDVLEYPYAVNMGSDSLEGLSEDDRQQWIDLKALKDILESITAVYRAIDGLRGFYLDRPWNRIGTNGWDTLLNAIKDEELFKF